MLYHVFSYFFLYFKMSFNSETMEYADFWGVHPFKKVLLAFGLMVFSAGSSSLPTKISTPSVGFSFSFFFLLCIYKIVKHIKFVMYAVTVPDD